MLVGIPEMWFPPLGGLCMDDGVIGDNPVAVRTGEAGRRLDSGRRGQKGEPRRSQVDDDNEEHSIGSDRPKSIGRAGKAGAVATDRIR